VNNLKVSSPKDKILHNKCQEVSLSEIRTKAFQDIIESMLNIVYGKNNKGTKRDTNKPSTVGLSANQVGINKRISIVDLGIGHKGYNDLYILINPEIYWYSKTKLKRSEGCVNLPEIWAFIERSKRVKVRALDRSGNRIQLDLNGWSAILLQHEVDHLNGKLFINRMKNPKKAHKVKDGQLKEYKKIKTNWDKFVDVSHLVKI
jgi:peptide deformylase